MNGILTDRVRCSRNIFLGVSALDILYAPKNWVTQLSLSTWGFPGTCCGLVGHRVGHAVRRHFHVHRDQRHFGHPKDQTTAHRSSWGNAVELVKFRSIWKTSYGNIERNPVKTWECWMRCLNLSTLLAKTWENNQRTVKFPGCPVA